MNKFSLLVFFLASAVFQSADVNAQTTQVCEEACAEDLRINCDDLLAQYTFQGSCCSLTQITAYDGCRVEVGFGNCYWFPKCEECPLRTEGRWNNIKCGLEYQGAEGFACPASEYPTVWKNPYPEGPWNDYSCSPTAAPAVQTAPPDSASASTSVRMMAALGAVVAVAQM